MGRKSRKKRQRRQREETHSRNGARFQEEASAFVEDDFPEGTGRVKFALLREENEVELKKQMIKAFNLTYGSHLKYKGLSSALMQTMAYFTQDDFFFLTLVIEPFLFTLVVDMQAERMTQELSAKAGACFSLGFITNQFYRNESLNFRLNAPKAIYNRNVVLLPKMKDGQILEMSVKKRFDPQGEIYDFGYTVFPGNNPELVDCAERLKNIFMAEPSVRFDESQREFFNFLAQM